VYESYLGYGRETDGESQGYCDGNNYRLNIDFHDNVMIGYIYINSNAYRRI